MSILFLKKKIKEKTVSTKLINIAFKIHNAFFMQKYLRRTLSVYFFSNAFYFVLFELMALS